MKELTNRLREILPKYSEREDALTVTTILKQIEAKEVWLCEALSADRGSEFIILAASEDAALAAVALLEPRAMFYNAKPFTNVSVKTDSWEIE